MTALATVPKNGLAPASVPQFEIPKGIEKALITGDLADLSPDQRMAFYKARCDAAGLDPRTQPFEYITLKGKLTLYAKKSASDQLIATHHLTVKILRRGFDPDFPGAYVAECQVAFPHGQTVEDVGVVWIPEKMGGDDLCNAIMKAVTKSKRRTVLSACGLGVLDESEIETIPSTTARVQQQPRSELRAALDAARGRPATIPAPAAEHASQEEPPPAPPRTEFGRWLDARIAASHEQWTEVARKAGADPGKPMSRQKVGNHLVKTWVEQGMFEESEVQTDGKRDAAKVALHVSGAFDEEPQEVASEVDDYLHADLVERARKAGVTLPGADEPETVVEPVAAPAGTPEAGSEEWGLGRE